MMRDETNWRMNDQNPMKRTCHSCGELGNCSSSFYILGMRLSSMSTSLVASQFGLSYLDKKAKFVLEWSFGKKLEFLKEVGSPTEQGILAVRRFQERRNQIFHNKSC